MSGGLEWTSCDLCAQETGRETPAHDVCAGCEADLCKAHAQWWSFREPMSGRTVMQIAYCPRCYERAQAEVCKTASDRLLTVKPDAPNHHLIRLARQSRGMPLGNLAKALDLPARDLQRIEQGLAPFPGDKVDMLATVLRYPRQFFYQEHDPSAVPFPWRVCRPWEDTFWEEWDDEQSEIGQLRRQVKALQAQVHTLKGDGQAR